MSLEQLKAFLAKVNGDSNLQNKLKDATNPDNVVAIAKESGFSISADDFETQSELSDGELEKVAGSGFTQQKTCTSILLDNCK